MENDDTSYLLIGIIDALSGNVLWSNIIYSNQGLYR
ncbi:hypothetical protein NF27_HS00080 [Candidatus Jidaibacter acanthamoeba]|uniref:Transposase n=1 Tax=Candidatus Jidaibacter acanthamoebae TaxID=86105 RepID=A0A0C1MWZ4_9RICK|nr:hypothetical protein NF27_HS00080 [Candidatus Jidaibacter acanthamoeba]